MQLEIRRQSVSLGVFSEEDVRRGYEIGRFIGTDKVQAEGSTEWDSLSDYLAGNIRKNVTGVFPWEAKDAEPVSAYFRTIKGVLLDPSATFQAMDPDGSWWKPLLFAYIGSFAGVILSIFYQLLFSFAKLQNMQEGMDFNQMRLPAIGIGVFFIAVIVVIFLPLAFILGAGIEHLMLMLLGGAKRSFSATFRTFCYSTSSVWPLYIIPCCGSVIGNIWGMVSRIIGYSEVHQISRVRATIAILLPLVFCCVCVAVLAAMIISIGVSTDTFKEMTQKFATV